FGDHPPVHCTDRAGAVVGAGHSPMWAHGHWWGSRPPLEVSSSTDEDHSRIRRRSTMNEVQQVPILLYHSARDDPVLGIERWNVTPAVFRVHLDAIVDRGCHTMTVSEYAAKLAAAEPLPERTVLITFDDGFAGVGTSAVPELASRGLASTL